MAETATKTVAAKLLIKPNQKVLIMNAPANMRELLGTLPDGAELRTQATGDAAYDVVVGFLHGKADADRISPEATKALKPGSVLWLCYPKQTAKNKIKADINRDHGWDVINGAGFLVVTAVAIDETWSALRFRPQSEIKTLARKF